MVHVEEKRGLAEAKEQWVIAKGTKTMGAVKMEV